MKGVLFRRALIVCMIVLLLAVIVLLGAYSHFGRNTYIQLELDSLSEVMETAQNLYLYRESMFVERSYYADTLKMLSNMNDVSFYYVDLIYMELRTNVPQYYDQNLESIRDKVLGGETIRMNNLKLTGYSAICVGAPLYNNSGDLEGGLILIRQTQYIDNAFDKLNSVLWLMGACILPVMLLFAYVSIRRLSRPFNDMTNVAIQLAQGNYNVRANEKLTGEVGIFARALNQMSDALSQTIYQLDSEKRQLGYILSSFSDGVAALDNLGNLTHYNPALMKMFGAVDVKHPIDLVPDSKIWDVFHEVLDSKEPRTMHYELPGDHALWISIVPVMTEAGDCTGVVGLFKDATEIERLERVRRDYVANISHELRTPLTAVRGLLEPLADGMVHDEETKKRYYGIMLHEVERLSRLITDMLQLSRLQSGTEYMESKEFDLIELVGDVVQSYQQEAAKRGVSLKLDACELSSVISDADRIEQVLVILIDNAMRYASASEKKLIRITITQDNKDAYVSVWDSGCGIADADIEHIFERFYKADKSRKEGGTGLGLSIAKQVLEKLGEHIEVESKAGEWTCFRFSIKKYVSNAIPLGPVDSDAIVYENMEGDGGASQQTPPDSRDTADDKPSLDAPYEVVEDEETQKKPKKRGKLL